MTPENKYINQLESQIEKFEEKCASLEIYKLAHEHLQDRFNMIGFPVRINEEVCYCPECLNKAEFYKQDSFMYVHEKAECPKCGWKWSNCT